ncbi:MAG: hypothetical protein HQK76_00600 [Desulfobacterales bacterium]|nr:hypothetical protein [Desulfobacterales bacterium]
MTQGVQEGEAIRKAIKRVSEQRLCNPNISIMTCVDKACLELNLAPKDAEFLYRVFSEQNSKSE